MLLKRFQASDKRVRQIKRRIRSYSVISFDIFDTLILRRVLKPSDVFRLMAPEVLKILSKSKNKSIDFPLERMKAERDARRDLMIRDGGDKAFEIDFAQIYAQLQKNLKLSDKQTQQIQKIELETELKCCVVHPKIKQVYDYCIQQKKQVWFVSDMYLAKTDIIKILKNAGYKHKDISKNVIVSSEYNATKHNGNLFKVLLEKSKAHPRYILHIGDSLKADVLGARKNKIRSSYLRKLFKPHHKKHHKYSLSKSVQIALQDINKLEDKDYFSNLGYSLIGPLMLQFCHWIYKDVKKRGIKKIYFLSRDGYLPYEAFKILFGHDKEVEPIYLLHSSRATGFNMNLDSSKNCFTDEQINFLCSHNTHDFMSVKDLFGRFGFDIRAYKNELISFGLSLNQTITLPNEKKSFKKLVLSLEPDIYAKIIQTQKNYLEYLKKTGFLNDKNAPIAIIDSGWSGRVQNNFYSLLKKLNYKKYLVGYYLGLSARAKKYQTSRSIYNGFLSQFDQPALKGKGLIEHFCSSGKGSLAQFEIKNKVFKPICLPKVQGEETTGKLNNLKKSALTFVFDYNKLCIENNDCICLCQMKFNRLFNKIWNKPSVDDAINIGSLEMDIFASNKNNKKFFVSLIRTKGVISKYISFLNSPWKAGHYKSLSSGDRILLFPLYVTSILSRYINLKNIKNLSVSFLKKKSNNK